MAAVGEPNPDGFDRGQPRHSVAALEFDVVARIGYDEILGHRFVQGGEGEGEQREPLPGDRGVEVCQGGFPVPDSAFRPLASRIPDTNGGLVRPSRRTKQKRQDRQESP